MKSASRVASFVVSLSLLFCVAAFSQNTGVLSGIISDSSGAVITGVKVEARNARTAFLQSAISNNEGAFAFPALPPGRYSVRIDHPGFKPFTSNGLDVTTGATTRADVVLEIGAQNDTVVVTESAVMVETSTTQAGGSITASKLTAIPVNGRSYTDLLALQPGVVPASSQQPNAVVMSGCTNTPPSGDLNPGNLSINGQRETANGFMVNGSSAQEDFNMGAAIVPNLDSIQELRVFTGNFDAEYGNFSGGQVLVATKSGTNQLHGSALEFLRNTDLNARNFFSPERAQYDRNQYGGAVGGPLRKDRIFFFADYQETRMTQGLETGLISVPSLANRTGDFSDNAASLSGTVNGQYWADQLSKRLGYAVQPGEPYSLRDVRAPLNAYCPMHAFRASVVYSGQEPPEIHPRTKPRQQHLLIGGKSRNSARRKGRDQDGRQHALGSVIGVLLCRRLQS